MSYWVKICKNTGAGAWYTIYYHLPRNVGKKNGGDPPLLITQPVGESDTDLAHLHPTRHWSARPAVHRKNLSIFTPGCFFSGNDLQTDLGLGDDGHGFRVNQQSVMGRSGSTRAPGSFHLFLGETPRLDALILVTYMGLTHHFDPCWVTSTSKSGISISTLQ